MIIKGFGAQARGTSQTNRDDEGFWGHEALPGCPGSFEKAH